jgi:hypothetical protein
VLIVKDSTERRCQSKMDRPTQRPFTITRVFSNNGTVEIKRNTSTKVIHIRRLKHFIIE